MSTTASQITSLTIVYSSVYSGTDERKHQSSGSLAFVLGIHWWPVNSPHKWPVTRKLFPFDDVIMGCVKVISNAAVFKGGTRNHLHDVCTNSLSAAHSVSMPSQWRHNDHDSVSNHQPHGCLLNRLFRRRSKKTSKLRFTGLCVGNSPGPVKSPHKGPVTRKMFPFDDVIMAKWIHMMAWQGNVLIIDDCKWYNWICTSLLFRDFHIVHITKRMPDLVRLRHEDLSRHEYLTCNIQMCKPCSVYIHLYQQGPYLVYVWYVRSCVHMDIWLVKGIQNFLNNRK